MIVSVPLRNNVFYLYLAVPKKRLHTELLDSMTTPFEIKRSLVQSRNTQKMVLVKFSDDPVPCRKRYNKGA